MFFAYFWLACLLEVTSWPNAESIKTEKGKTYSSQNNGSLLDSALKL
jgi:hypothetical protein